MIPSDRSSGVVSGFGETGTRDEWPRSAYDLPAMALPCVGVRYVFVMAEMGTRRMPWRYPCGHRNLLMLNRLATEHDNHERLATDASLLFGARMTCTSFVETMSTLGVLTGREIDGDGVEAVVQGFVELARPHQRVECHWRQRDDPDTRSTIQTFG